MELHDWTFTFRPTRNEWYCLRPNGTIKELIPETTSRSHDILYFALKEDRCLKKNRPKFVNFPQQTLQNHQFFFLWKPEVALYGLCLRAMNLLHDTWSENRRNYKMGWKQTWFTKLRIPGRKRASFIGAIAALQTYLRISIPNWCKFDWRKLKPQLHSDWSKRQLPDHILV